MTVRVLVWSAYWTVALALGEVAVAAVPFTGLAGTAVALVAATGVGLIAAACSPTTPTISRKDGRP